MPPARWPSWNSRARWPSSLGPRRTVVFALWGSEELGMPGSTIFSEVATFDLHAIVANLELRVIARPDRKLQPDQLWLTGWKRSDLGPALAEHGAKLGGRSAPGAELLHSLRQLRAGKGRHRGAHRFQLRITQGLSPADGHPGESGLAASGQRDSLDDRAHLVAGKQRFHAEVDCARQAVATRIVQVELNFTLPEEAVTKLALPIVCWDNWAEPATKQPEAGVPGKRRICA